MSCIPDIKVALDGCLFLLLLFFAGIFLDLLNFGKVVVAAFAPDLLKFCEICILSFSMDFQFPKLLTKQGQGAIKLMVLFRFCFMLFMLFMMLVLFMFRDLLFWFLSINLLFEDGEKFRVLGVEVLDR